MPIPAHLFNPDLERAVLGRLLSEPQHIGAAAELTAEHFSLSATKLIFTSLRKLYEAGNPVSSVTVAADIHNFGQIDAVGGVTGVVAMTEFAVMAYDLEHSIGRLADLAVIRRALADAYQLVNQLETAGSTVEDIAKFETLAQNASVRGGKRVRLRTVSEVVHEYPGGVNAFLQPFQGQKYMRFPWAKAQHQVGGLWPGEVMIIGGRPGSGKSAAAMQLARFNSALGTTPAIFNLEMSDHQTIWRTVCARAGVPMSRFRIGEMSESEQQAIYTALRRFAGERVLLCDRPTLTITEIRAALKKAVRTQGVDLAIIDYLQLADAGIKSDNRQQEVSHLSRACKLMAMECGVPLIVLAQLSRKSDDQNREPGLSDIRESGSIEQDADIVMFTHRKQEAVVGSPSRNSYRMLFRKVRNGPDGAFGVHWDAKSLEFRDLESDRNAV